MFATPVSIGSSKFLLPKGLSFGKMEAGKGDRMVRLEECFEKDASIVFRKVGEEYVLIPYRREKSVLPYMYSLEGVGARIWELLDGTKDNRRLIQKLSSEFEVAKSTITKDILSFLAHLKKERLIKPIRRMKS